MASLSIKDKEAERSSVKILFLSSEAVPFAKTGGLGDVSGVLPRALAASAQVTLVIPGYRTKAIQEARAGIVDEFALKIGENSYPAVIRETKLGDVSVVFIQNSYCFDRQGLYGDDSGDYPDNFSRFLF